MVGLAEHALGKSNGTDKFPRVDGEQSAVLSNASGRRCGLGQSIPMDHLQIPNGAYKYSHHDQPKSAVLLGYDKHSECKQVLRQG